MIDAAILGKLTNSAGVIDAPTATPKTVPGCDGNLPKPVHRRLGQCGDQASGHGAEQER